MAVLTQATADFLKAYDPWTWARYVIDGTLDATGKVKDDPLGTSPPPPAPPPEVPDTPPPAPPETPSTYSGPSAREEIDALLPTGFEQAAVGSSLTDPLAAKARSEQRATAQDFIGRMLRRGTLDEAGRVRAQSALDLQDPIATKALGDYGNTLLAAERNKLVELANTGRTAAGSQAGEFFDPNPYKESVDRELASFTAGLPVSYASGAPANLYSTGNLGEVAGAVTGPRNLSYDPYAVEGGNLQTGLEEESGTQKPSKRRSTSVF